MRRVNGTARTDFDPNCYGKSNGDGNYFYPSPGGTEPAAGLAVIPLHPPLLHPP